MSPRDLTLRGLFDQVFNAFSAVDGRLLRSFRCLLWQPGALSRAYEQGRRMPFTAPFRIFLFANMLFFAMQSLTLTSIVSETLASHMHDQDWSTLAQWMVSRRLAAQGTTLDLYAPVFDHAVTLNAKSLIILMVLPFALALALTFLRDRRPFAAHAVFALHFYAFLLILFCGLLAIAAIDMRFGGTGMADLDKPLFALTLAASAAYLHRATGVMYRAHGWRRLLQVIALTLIAGAMISGYRFVIFVITLYTT